MYIHSLHSPEGKLGRGTSGCSATKAVELWQPSCSSLPSWQSVSPSHSQLLNTQLPLVHWNCHSWHWSGPSVQPW